VSDTMGVGWDFLIVLVSLSSFNIDTQSQVAARLETSPSWRPSHSAESSGVKPKSTRPKHLVFFYLKKDDKLTVGGQTLVSSLLT